MKFLSLQSPPRIVAIWFLFAALVMMACSRSANIPEVIMPTQAPRLAITALARLTETPPLVSSLNIPQIPTPGGPILTPTPDAPHALPDLRSGEDTYTVQPRDTLFLIAQRYQVSISALIEANQLVNPDYLEVGQVLQIPAPDLGPPGPAFKVIPDSELVYGPASVGFDVVGYINSQAGHLSRYSEEIDGEMHTGAQVVQRIAQEFSVNPRLLLAVLEYRSGWVRQALPENAGEMPILVAESWRKGLYLQLAFVANQLNRGYYLWKAGAVGQWVMQDGVLVPADPTINPGTAAVQHLFAFFYSRPDWEIAVGESGLSALYQQMFAYPFHLSIEPLLPENLTQPLMLLPFEPGEIWAFTGGPHGGWGDGSAWAALDFAPPGEALGCVISDAWVTAVADGTIVRTGHGAVIQDVDVNGAHSDDGYEQTGWVMLYMHIEARDRVMPGVYVRAGEKIGHPSCEGGISSGTHVHLARRYNGEWIAADGSLPFVLDGWVSLGTGTEYDGYLQKEDRRVEAWADNRPENKIAR